MTFSQVALKRIRSTECLLLVFLVSGDASKDAPAELDIHFIDPGMCEGVIPLNYGRGAGRELGLSGVFLREWMWHVSQISEPSIRERSHTALRVRKDSSPSSRRP
jgi:hypothetical protein